ncbi:EAL domain-containing protein [Alishewanella longhuensis]
MGRNFGIEVIAEGIENKEQYHKLAGQGVTMGQGWLFGKPMTAQALKATLSKQPSKYAS